MTIIKMPIVGRATPDGPRIMSATFTVDVPASDVATGYQLDDMVLWENQPHRVVEVHWYADREMAQVGLEPVA